MSGRTSFRRITSYSRSTTRTYGASKPLEDFPGFHQKEADSGQSESHACCQEATRDTRNTQFAVGSIPAVSGIVHPKSAKIRHLFCPGSRPGLNEKV